LFAYACFWGRRPFSGVVFSFFDRTRCARLTASPSSPYEHNAFCRGFFFRKPRAVPSRLQKPPPRSSSLAGTRPVRPSARLYAKTACRRMNFRPFPPLAPSVRALWKTPSLSARVFLLRRPAENQGKEDRSSLTLGPYSSLFCVERDRNFPFSPPPVPYFQRDGPGIPSEDM